ncbi:Rne/Rng family ribonuclease [Roseovarius arcticus]|uniref:Rne/Rng family ribonuclease n=1 Tax=Roseovarius arcticus TaxID=2547404 RepID=UPI001110523C|nr:ribonuclease E/G [Roseovarius arcticus]
MAKKMLIDATHAEETRVVVVDGNKVEEFDFESENRRQLAGNIYLAKVTRVEPSLQAAFIDYGGNRHGFLAFSEIHPDYYQIPVADREALMEEERAYAEAQEAEEEERAKPKGRSRGGRGRSRAAKADSDDAVTSAEVSGMETIDLDENDDEGSSPMERVAETPVEEPEGDETGGETGADTDDDNDAPKPRRTRTRTRSKSTEDDGDDDGPDAADKDDSIEVVADEDTQEDIRPPRKPRPRKYKIQEVVKVRQILLVQVVKEERGNKGAALTTYLSLAGRYCVLMPNTARGGGISRKITNAPDRKKLKEIANEIAVPKGAGLIVRTAGAKRTKPEIKRDYEYLQRMWEQIRELTLKSIAPAKIYEEGDLIKRSIRDLYNREIDEVLVEGERGYRIAKDFMKMIMPSHAKNVKNYVDTMPLFARFQVESYLNSMFNPTVQLRSGGYIVIGVTEALVAIDVNSGRATKEGSIEDTATKTNLEAAEEVARQLRLRDLAGLIVIDFIDMDERKNNAAVEKRMKDKLKTDRARIQVSRISGFGLMEMSRQRLRPGMIEATTQPCPSCHGTGLIRSDDNLALNILRQVEEEGTKGRSLEVLLRAPVGIANFLMNQKREHIAQIEVRYGLSVRVEGDPSLISPDFALEKFKTATRAVPEQVARVVSVDSSLMDDIDAETEVDPDEWPGDDDEAEDENVQQSRSQNDAENGNGNGNANGNGNGEDEDGKPKKRRRRRRRGKSSKSREDGENGNGNGENGNGENGESSDGDADANANQQTGDHADATDNGEVKKRRSRSRGRKPASDNNDADRPAAATEVVDAAEVAGEPDQTAQPASEDAPKPKRTRKPRAKKVDADAPAASPETAPAADSAEDIAAEDAPKPKPARKPRARKSDAAPAQPVADIAPEIAVPPAPEPQSAPEPTAAAKPAPEPTPPAEAEADASKPKRKGWWSLGR